MTHRLNGLALALAVLLSPIFSHASCDQDLGGIFQPPEYIPPYQSKMTDSGPVEKVTVHELTDQIPMNPRTIAAAYAQGIFPWSVTEQGNARWFELGMRGILEFKDLHVSQSDKKLMRRLEQTGQYNVTFDKAFAEVMAACQAQTRTDNMWITAQHMAEYPKLAAMGMAHSVEVWEDDVLVGGLYGIFVNGYFSGESMFHDRPDVTKLAYVALVERLLANGHTFIDTQMNLGITKKWGGKEIPRAEFKKMLAEAREANRPF